MHTKHIVKAPKGRKRRRHADEFKRQVVDACLQPGVSMAAVALANGLNANLVRRWVNDLGSGPLVNAVSVRSDAARTPPPPPTLVPVTVSLPDVAPSGEIKIEIHRQDTVVQVTWPVAQAVVCAQWLCELLR